MISKQKTILEAKGIQIEGLDDFPLEVLGLTAASIERSGGHIRIPIELIPYIKIVRAPKHIRDQRAKYKRDYLLRVDLSKSGEELEKQGKRPTPYRRAPRRRQT